jgi:lipid II:glycine glycyltransferase (peptidoglycan interpeptide bridge formation enzyme)
MLLFSRIADLRGERIVSGPFCDYCDPMAKSLEAWRELVAPLLTQRLPMTLRCLRNAAPLQDDRFTIAGRAAWHGVDLTRTEADLWQYFNGSARQNIRKARRLGVTVREGRSLNDLRLFFEMHCRVRKEKYRLLPQPFSFFEALHSEFSPQDRIVTLLAEANGAVLAGIVFLQWRDTLYYKFNASAALDACPNDLLVWEGIRMGLRRGLAQLDFGASDYAQPGLLRYKAKYATEQREIIRLRWQPPGYSDPRAEEAGRTLTQITDILTRPEVPDAITRDAGEALYGLFC